MGIRSGSDPGSLGSDQDPIGIRLGSGCDPMSSRLDLVRDHVGIRSSEAGPEMLAVKVATKVVGRRTWLVSAPGSIGIRLILDRGPMWGQADAGAHLARGK